MAEFVLLIKIRLKPGENQQLCRMRRRIVKIKNLHSWEVTPEEATQIQRHLAPRIKSSGPHEEPRYVAGADISFFPPSPAAYAGIVVLDFPSLKLVAQFTIKDRLRFPYVPGLLSFREAPTLLHLFQKIRPAPQLIFFDGHGLAHPRAFGLACHMGLFLNRPAIGWHPITVH